MTLKQAAAALNISVATARRWVKDGRLESSIVNGPHGNAFYISQAAIDKAKNDHRVPVIVQSLEPAVSVAEMQRMVESSMTNVLASRMSVMMNESMNQMQDSILRMDESVSNRIATLKDGIDVAQEHAEMKAELKNKVAEIAALKEEISMLRGVIEGMKVQRKKWSLFGKSWTD